MDNQYQNSATFEEIVFENRNKSYGAFFLRKIYDKNVLQALAYSSLIFAALLLIPLIKAKLNKDVKVIEVPKKKPVLTVIDVPLDPRTPPPPPLPKIEIPQVKAVKFVVLEVAKKDEEVNEPAPVDQDKLKNTAVSNENKAGVEDPSGELPTNLNTGVIGGTGEGDEDNQPWTGPITDEVSFPGGVPAFINSRISERLKDYVRDRGIKGRLFIVVIIGKDGQVMSADVQPGREIPNCKLCSEEVVDIIKTMPKWTPAKNNGNPVIRRIAFPIVF